LSRLIKSAATGAITVLVVLAFSLSSANVARAQAPLVEYDNEHDFKLTWHRVRQGLTYQVFVVEIQNLQAVARTGVPFKLVFENLNAKLADRIYSTGDPNPKISLWMTIPTQITVYDKVFLKATYTIGNVLAYEKKATLSGENYTRFVGNVDGPNFALFRLENENVGAGFENLIQNSDTSFTIEYIQEQLKQRVESSLVAQWVYMPIVFRDKANVPGAGGFYDQSFLGNFDFPALNSPAVRDANNETVTENGTIKIKLEFELAETQSAGGGWGASGYTTIFDPELPEGLSVETWTVQPPPPPSPPPPPTPPYVPSTPPPVPETINTETLENYVFLLNEWHENLRSAWDNYDQEYLKFVAAYENYISSFKDWSEQSAEQYQEMENAYNQLLDNYSSLKTDYGKLETKLNSSLTELESIQEKIDSMIETQTQLETQIKEKDGLLMILSSALVIVASVAIGGLLWLRKR